MAALVRVDANEIADVIAQKPVRAGIPKEISDADPQELENWIR
jgi:hypothetical protein